MHVSEIWRYAVKSMMGERVDHARLGETGIEGDRRWALRDLQRGGIDGAKRIAPVMQFAASYVGDGPAAQITFPDGTSAHTSDADLHERLSAAVGREVRLEALRPASDTEFYAAGRMESDDPVTEVRAIMGREGDEPLPDFSIFPPEIFMYASPPGAFYDAFPLMIMTTSGLRSLTEALPDSRVDVRRFRPSFVVDTGDQPGYPEFAWPMKSHWRLGDAVVEINAPCPRCVMPTREINADLPRDGRIMRYIVRELDQNIGIYATVVEPGPFSVGDAFVPC